MQFTKRHGTIVGTVPNDWSMITQEADANDIIGACYGSGADWVAIPTARLSVDFLQLRTGLAGAFIQKFVTYGFHLAFVGDISAEIAKSTALRDFIGESNRMGQVVFVPDFDAIDRFLKR